MCASARIKKIRELLSLTQKDLAKLLGISQGYVCDVENERFPPGGKFFRKLSENLNVNLNWLISGEGEPFRTEKTQPKSKEKTEPLGTLSVKEDHEAYHIKIPKPKPTPAPKFTPHQLAQPSTHQLVPLMSLEAAAGHPRIVEDEIEDYIPVAKSLLGIKKSSRDYQDRFSAIRITGNSMEPIISTGSICIIDHSQTDPRLLRHHAIAAKINDEATIKFLDQDQDHFILRPLNPEYPLQIIDKHDPGFRILGRIILLLRQL